MISIVLYGRNDNYGYNLHKRAALSFNCMAEVLHDDDDEILFVDYNTPDDFPTFPEAIQDTLSEKARKRLRVLRVRPHVHSRFGAKTRLVALEPISRNVAVRRSNPANRWILSTNTDMIFVPQRARSLNEIARDLPAGFYHAPRIEIPETLWEGLDRNNAREAIETVREWGSALHINEIVFGSPLILYDAPGDFQLMQRSDLFDIHGFDEEMLLGWHVDSNIAKRLTMLRGKVRDLGKEIYGYHCDHARQVTLMHSHSRTENDWRRFIEDVPRPELPEQAKSWGCADDEIEEIRLNGQRASAYVRALKKQMGERQSTPPEVAYVGENYNKTDYDPRHVLPYLADMFVCCERGTNVAWFGARPDLLARFAGFWKDLGFTGDILVDGNLVGESGLVTAPEAVKTSFDVLLGKADAFVFDFGPVSKGDDAFAGLPRRSANALNRALLTVVTAEHLAMGDGKPLRRVIGVNAINNLFESTITSHIGAAHTPYSARMRNGFVLPPMKGKVDWTSQLQVGHAGVRDGSVVRSREGTLGPVIYGPYRHLHVGRYRFRLSLFGNGLRREDVDQAVAVLEIVSQREHIGYRLITLSDLAKGEVELDVDVTADLSLSPGFSVQTLFRTVAPVDVAISAVSCERVSDLKSTDAIESRALAVSDWLPLLWTGPAGLRKSGYILQGSAEPGIVFYGPYWRLPKGSYEATFVLEPLDKQSALRATVHPRWDETRLLIGHRWRRFRKEPMGQLATLGRILRAKYSESEQKLDLGRFTMQGLPLCTFQAVSQETELASRHLFVGDWRLANEVAVSFSVTGPQSEDPDFALEFRLLAHTQLPFGFKSVTVRKVGT